LYLPEGEIFLLLKEALPAAHYPPIITPKNPPKLIPHHPTTTHLYLTLTQSPYSNQPINFTHHLPSTQPATKKYQPIKYHLSKPFSNHISTYHYKKQQFIHPTL
ncbi:GrpB family protein, partial [Priestia megaterium]|uniref:GrpB family protein n=1 Tax=Priestia megaterium TaxID=1404 RepID=UPI0016498210